MVDYFRYYKGCEECQKFGNIQPVPAAMLYPIIKPWPFRGWGQGARLHWPNSSPSLKGTDLCGLLWITLQSGPSQFL
jgi:hypothetical protein